MAAHLKNEVTEDKKNHNLMTWLNSFFLLSTYIVKLSLEDDEQVYIVHTSFAE